jgi:hypothetical protein
VLEVSSERAVVQLVARGLVGQFPIIALSETEILELIRPLGDLIARSVALRV